MLTWLSRLVAVMFAIAATFFAGGVVLGAASAETHVAELLVTCLLCGEHWLFAPSTTVMGGVVSLFGRRGTPADTCPKCGGRVVAFGHVAEHREPSQG